jgi:hypothetical protein
MTTGVTISTAHNDARLTGTLTYLDTGSGYARVRIYSGTRPASGGTVTTMLVEIALSKPSGVVSSGVLTLASTDLPLIANSGVATWARVVNGNGDYAFDCDVSTTTAGTGQVQLPDTTLLAGGTTQLASGVLG